MCWNWAEALWFLGPLARDLDSVYMAQTPGQAKDTSGWWELQTCTGQMPHLFCRSEPSRPVEPVPPSTLVDMPYLFTRDWVKIPLLLTIWAGSWSFPAFGLTLKHSLSSGACLLVLGTGTFLVFRHSDLDRDYTAVPWVSSLPSCTSWAFSTSIITWVESLKSIYLIENPD